MVSTNRSRITIDLAGAWRLYATGVPAGAEVLGTIAQGPEVGALIRYRGTGLYAQLNAGAVRSLDQRKVHAALEGARGPQG